MPAAPSLLIVPYRSKTGRLYSQIPVPVAPATTGAGDFTVTRNTEARRFNSAGLLESVASGIPRLDYYTSGGTAGCPALLVEPAATNFARGVELLNTPTPVTASGGITITTGSTDFLAPDGSSGTITKYVGGTASGSNFIEYVSSTSVTASGVHTFSAFVKAGATNPLNFCALQLTAYTAASGTATSYFNLASGTALTAGATIQNYGNGWYRIISAPYTIAAGDLAGSIRLLFAEADNDVNWPASGALNLTVYAWGIQLEAGSVATSYIPTTAASGSRSADVISVTGAVSGSIGQTEGTLYFEIDVQKTATATRNVVEVTDGTSSNRFFARLYDDSGTQRLEVALISSGGFAARYQNLAMPAGIYKVAFGYALNNFACFVNGIQNGSTDTSGNCSASYSTINLGSAAGNVSFFNDRIRAAALYTTRLTNAELQSLTTL